MAKRLAIAVVSVFAVSLLLVGASGAVVCDPHCAPAKSNQGGELRGLDRANAVAGDHGAQGRANAADHQGIGDPPPPPPPPPPVTPPPPPPPPPGPCSGC